MSTSPTTLDAIPPGVSVVVRRVRGARPITRRLMEMGLLPGTRVTVTRVAPMGDPLQLRVRDYALSIRKGDAAGVEVEVLPAAEAAE